MIKVIRLHYYYILTFKTRFLITTLFLITSLVILYLTRFYDDRVNRILYQNVYAMDYYFESLNFLKITLTLLNLYIVLQLWYLNPYDIVLIQRIGRFKVFLSKLMAGLSISLLFMFIAILLVTILGFRFNLNTVHTNYVTLMIYLIIFTSFYHILMIGFSFLYHHILSQFIVFICMLIGSILVDFLMSVHQIHWAVILYNSIFVNLHIVENFELTFIVSPIYVSFLMALLGGLSYLMFSHRDF